VGGALDDLDDEFHASYERSRTDLAPSDPVFVVLANDLVLFHRGQRTEWSFSPRAYQLIKMVSHVPLTIFCALHPVGGEPAQHSAARTDSLRAWIAQAKPELAREERELGAETMHDLRTVLDASDALLQRGHARITPDAAKELAEVLGPVLLRLIDRATQLQLDALHAHVEAALQGLMREELARMQVVVTGNHQARVRSLPMQYFRHRLREPEGVELRVTYAEAVSSEQEALALIGTKKLDREIAQAFFGDRNRMQRDLLGDAAQARLRSSALPSID
jgi:hypothetical protein